MGEAVKTAENTVKGHWNKVLLSIIIVDLTEALAEPQAALRER